MVTGYTEPKPKPPPHPEYRIVPGDGLGGSGLLAVLPVLPPRRGPKPQVMVLPIVEFEDGAFLVKSHASVLSKHFNGIYATLIFEDGSYVLSPDASDTGTYNEERDALVPRVTTAAPMVEDSQSSDSEEEEELQVDESPKPLRKKKRVSSANATAMMAARK